MIQRGEFLTSYTPYQPEITQGTLQYLFEFQTQVALLTGMEVANASMYDGSTACAEAVLMANRVTRRDKALLSGGLHPHYRSIIETTRALARLSAPSPASPTPKGCEDLIARDRRARPPASSCRTRASSATSATSRSWPRPATPRARC